MWNPDSKLFHLSTSKFLIVFCSWIMRSAFTHLSQIKYWGISSFFSSSYCQHSSPLQSKLRVAFTRPWSSSPLRHCLEPWNFSHFHPCRISCLLYTLWGCDIRSYSPDFSSTRLIKSYGKSLRFKTFWRSICLKTLFLISSVLSNCSFLKLKHEIQQ